MNINFLFNSVLVTGLIGPLVVGLVVGSVLLLIGQKATDKKLKQDAIRDLMTFRGDYASTNFRESLNKVSITFHKNEEIRTDVRHLYDVINNPSSPQKIIERTIIGLIYKLCQKNGFKGLTEYDIDQSFIIPQQDPTQAISTPNITEGNPTK